MKTKTNVGGYTIEAEVKNGLLHVLVCARSKREVLAVDYNNKVRDGCDSVSFSDNPNILDCVTSSGPFETNADLSYSPKALRKAGKDPVFRKWWIKSNKGTPEQWAEKIEERQRINAAAKKAGPKKTEAAAGGTRSRN